jgi:predicted Holliday junction resolvase-like endonuclease
MHLNVLKSKRGEGYMDVIVAVLVILLLIALAIKVLPVFIAKNQLDTFAAELIREAEIAGQVGSETATKEAALKTQTNLNPTISWSRTGKIQLNEEVTVTLSSQHDIGFFTFGSFPITLTSKATGKSEVYWK